jgi:hypothetical protein
MHLFMPAFRPEPHQLWIGQNFDGVHIIDLYSKKEIKSVKITDAAIFDIKSWGEYIFIATGDGSLMWWMLKPLL